MKKIIMILAAVLLAGALADKADACTGISLTASDGSRIVARTVEWAATPMQCGYVVAPRGHAHQSYTPTGENVGGRWHGEAVTDEECGQKPLDRQDPADLYCTNETTILHRG